MNKKIKKTVLTALVLSSLLGSYIPSDAAKLNISSLYNNKSLPNSSFKIRNINNDFYLGFNSITKGVYSYSENGSFDIVKSDSQGELSIKNLPEGKYYIEPMQGNSLSAETQVINISNDNVEGQATVNFGKKSGSVNLRLTSSDGKNISSAAFSLSNSSGTVKASRESDGVYVYDPSSSNTNFITNKYGRLNIKNLPTGNYVIEQRNTAQGYTSLFSSSIYVDGLVNLNPVNYKSQDSSERSSSDRNSEGELVLSVKGEDGKNIAGFYYKIYENGREIENIKTNDEDKTLSLKEGTYYIEESKGLDGYDKLEKKSFTIKSGDRTTINIKKKKSEGKLIITKTDLDDKKGVKGFGFNISNSSGVLNFEEKDGKYYYNKDGRINLLKTNKDGKIEIEKIPSGNVKIKEIEGPSGYKLITGSIEKNIIANNTTKYNSNTEKLKNTLLFKDKETLSLMKGVEYKIRNENNEIVQEGTSSDEPIVLKVDGTYTISVDKVPERFSLPSNDFKVTMKNQKLDSQEVLIEEATISAYVGSNKAGEEFTLYKDSNKYETAKTDANGIVQFKNLGYGEYSIKQTGSMNGEVSSKEYNITIDAKYSNPKEPLKFYKEIKNEKNKNTTKKKINIKYIILFLSLLGLSSLLGYYYYLVKKMKNNIIDEINIKEKIEGKIVEFKSFVLKESSPKEEKKKFDISSLKKSFKEKIEKIKNIFISQ